MDPGDGVIELQGVSKWYRIRGHRHWVLRDVSCAFPRRQSVGILGRNGVGKSTLVRLLGGTEAPNAGRIVRRVRVSWPLGLGGSFQGSLTGRENVRFVARIYDLEFERIMAFVEEFSELGRFLNEPVATYSSGMRAKFAFGVSVAVDFDVYLIDELTAVGDADFKRKCEAVLAERRETATTIVVSHSPKTIRKLCQQVALLRDAALHWYDDVEAGIAAYEAA
jgi:capsular polysaccharide transport system ATP-binding protein